LHWGTQRNVGPITLGFEAAPDKVDACVAAVFAELPRIKEASYLSDEDLQNAVHGLEIDLARERERSSAYAHSITFWWTSAGLVYYRGYLDHARRVTRADIARYLDTYVLGKPFVFGAMLSPEMAARGLDRAHFEKLAGVPPTRERPRPAAKPRGAVKPAKPSKPARKGGK